MIPHFVSQTRKVWPGDAVSDRREKVLFIVPAKGSSSRVPKKNLRPLAGLPLFLWTVRAALGVSGYDAEVVVSTDDPEIARLTVEEGARLVMRPPELAKDPAQAPDVALHVLDEVRSSGFEPDAVCMLLPTSPFRSTQHITEALTLHFANRQANVVSVTDCRADFHHKLCWVLGDRITAGPPLRDLGVQSGALLLNGAIWITTPGRLVVDRFVEARNAVPYFMDDISGIDIDTELDIAKAFLLTRIVGIPPKGGRPPIGILN